MREIKFRAWATKQKKMYYDVGLDSRGIEVCWYDDGLEEDTIVGDRKENSLLQYTILMQYTGLKDKNGVEIYEADIINGSGVGFSTTSSEVYFGCDGAQVEIGDHWIQLSNFKEREIIGNKYETKME